MKWACEIERVDNGFILRNTSTQEEETTEWGGEVFQDKEDCYSDDDDFEAMSDSLVDLFWRLTDYFGIHNSKHYAKRLDIQVVDSKCDFEERCNYLDRENKDLRMQYDHLNNKYEELKSEFDRFHR